MTKTAYVTGSTGFLGLNIVEALLQQGWQVFALRRRSSNTRDIDRMKALQVEGDVTDIESLRRSMPEQVDAIFNVAADTGMWSKLNARQNKINIDGTRNLVQVALEKKAGRFIHTSSIGAFGDIHGPVIDEQTPLIGNTSKINYYRTKYLAELEVFNGIKKGLDAVILNPAQIVGPYDYNYTPLIFDSIKSGAMWGVPQGSSVCGHVRDYANAHLAAYEKGRSGERYLLGGVHASFQDIIDVVSVLMHKKPPRIPFPPLLMSVLAVIMEKISLVTNKEPLLSPEKVMLMNLPVRVSSKKAEQELGFSTCSLQEMYTDCYHWMQTAGLA